MRLLVATSDYPPDLGGMSRYSAEHVRSLTRRGHDVRVATAPRAPFVAGLREARSTLRRAAADFAPDAVWAHAWSPWGLAASLGLPGAPRLLLTVHGAEVLNPAASRRYRPLVRFALRAADRVLAVSRFSADAALALGADPARVDVVPNAVDPARFAPGPRRGDLVERWGLAGRRVVLTVGGLVERKGHDLVLRAVAALAPRRPDLVYLVVGGWTLAGSREADLKRLAVDLGIAGRVVFAGQVSEADLPDVYRLADVFAMPGRYVAEKGYVEGFGIAYLEAAASGVPSVAADAGGAIDAVEDGATGIVVPPDDAAAVAAAIDRLLGDEELRRRLGEAGRRRVLAGYTWDAVAARVEEIAAR